VSGEALAFSYRSSRSGSVVAAIVAAVAIETVALHFAVSSRLPMLAWIMTLTSLFAIVWLVRDYVAMGTGTVILSNESLRLEIGARFDITIPLGAIVRAFQPTFRDLPTPGTNQGRDYINLTKPSSPNVLIMLEAPHRVRLALGIHRVVTRIGLRLDDGAAFLAAVAERRAAASLST
jgi:hypothetical protein